MGINQYIKIGTRIKEARLAKQIPQKEMAKRLSLSVSTYSNYENNYREPKLDLIHRICDELDISLDELLGTSNMSSMLIDEISKQLLKDDVIHAKKELKNIFQKQLDGIQLTEEETMLFNNFLYRYLTQNRSAFDNIPVLNTNNTHTIHTGGIDWELNEILQKARRKEELTQEEQQQFSIYLQTFNERWGHAKERMNKHLKRLQTTFEQLNESGQEKADEQIDHLIDQLELLTKIPEYQKNPETKTAAPEREPQDGETDTH